MASYRAWPAVFREYLLRDGKRRGVVRDIKRLRAVLGMCGLIRFKRNEGG